MDIKITKKKNLYRNKFIYLALVVVGIAVYAYSFFGSSDSTLRVDRNKLKFSTASTAEFNDFVPTRATVTPIVTIFLDAVQGGSVVEVFVEEGVEVKKGQTLARLNNIQLQLDVISREAEVSEQLNSLRNTRLAMERNLLEMQERRLRLDYEVAQQKRLMEKSQSVVAAGGISKNDLVTIEENYQFTVDQRKLVNLSLSEQQRIREEQLEQLQSNSEHLLANLIIARKNLESLNIYSSIDGQLSAFELKAGQSISAGERIGQVDDVRSFKLEAFIDEFYVNQVSVGQQAHFDLEGKRHLAIIRKISPEVLNGQFKVELRFSGDSPEGIRRGQTIRLKLGLSAPEQALVLTAGSYMQDTGGNWLFVVNKDGKSASKRTVRIGRSNPDFVEILDGVSEGERVVVSSYREYKNYEDITF